MPNAYKEAEKLDSSCITGSKIKWHSHSRKEYDCFL